MVYSECERLCALASVHTNDEKWVYLCTSCGRKWKSKREKWSILEAAIVGVSQGTREKKKKDDHVSWDSETGFTFFLFFF